MPKFEIYRGSDKGEQCWRWRFLLDNNTNIARGGEPFHKSSVIQSIKTIQRNVENADIAEDESAEDKDLGYRFEYFRSDKWYWRLKSGNHEIMAIDGEGFSSEAAVVQQINLFRNNAVGAQIDWENEQDDPAFQEKYDDRTETRGIDGS